jgi:hypothetical protein
MSRRVGYVAVVSAGATIAMPFPTVVRVVVLGGLEPFVFAKSSFILFSLFCGQKNRQTQTGLAFGNRCDIRRIVLPTGDCAVWWKDR